MNAGTAANEQAGETVFPGLKSSVPTRNRTWIACLEGRSSIR